MQKNVEAVYWQVGFSTIRALFRMNLPTTDFGYQQVPLAEKAKRVAAVFSSVATQYDLMNDLMSAGVHRLWKRFTVDLSHVRPGQQILDLAGGTGDLAGIFASKVGPTGNVCLGDINSQMLCVGRDRLLDRGITQNVHYTQLNAESLPFPDNSFDCVSIAFGLRNVTQKDVALKEMYRILSPAGRLLILEFSKPIIGLLETLYDAYSFNILPKLGAWVTGDAKSYQYLVESIRKHPDQLTLKNMLGIAGFDHCEYHNLSGGIVALHRAWKY